MAGRWQTPLSHGVSKSRQDRVPWVRYSEGNGPRFASVATPETGEVAGPHDRVFALFPRVL